ncbi:hypothetical protein B0O99DRAFT_644642 [Bisporella sp. PMI_857]|nr:hypothetical protein B0O99DRAFT_644642 [Bisporella sp. PMI_857]
MHSKQLSHQKSQSGRGLLFAVLPQKWETYLSHLSSSAIIQGATTNLAHINYRLCDFRPEATPNRAMIDGYLSLVRTATDGLRQRIMPVSFFEALKDGGYGDDWKEISKAEFPTITQFIIPVVDMNNYTYAVVQRESPSLIQVFCRDSEIAQMISVWARGMSEEDVDIRINHGKFDERAVGTSTSLTLVDISLAAAGYALVTPLEAQDVIPRVNTMVLAQLLSQQLTPNDADFNLRLVHTNRRSTPPLSPSWLQVSPGLPRRGNKGAHSRKRMRIDSIEPEEEPDPSEANRVSESLSERYALDFADPKALVKIWAPLVYQIRNPTLQSADWTENAELPELWRAVKCSSKPLLDLQERRKRARFARSFYASVGSRGARDTQDASLDISLIGTKIGLRNQNGITDQAREATKKAAQYDIWKKIEDIFRPKLNQACYIALCAVPTSTTNIERMTHPEKQVFLERIQSRVADPDDQLSQRLEEQIEDVIALEEQRFTDKYIMPIILRWLDIDELKLNV